MSRRTWNTGGPLKVALFTLVAILGTIGFWSARTQISGAVIGAGKVTVAANTTSVQHPIGGVVAQINVQDGDHVDAGDVLVRLEDVQLRTKLATTEGALYETLANLARHEAVIDGRQELTLHPLLQEGRDQDPDIAALVRSQEKQLAAHYEAIAIEQGLLREQVAQVREQIKGVQAELAAETQSAVVIAEELKQREELAAKNLVKFADLYRSRRDTLTVQGKIGRLGARAAELQGKVTELELKLHTLVPKRREKADEALSKLRPARIKLIEERVSLMADLARLDIRAPISGTVHDSKVQGLQSVVVMAKPLMEIVPSDAPTLVELRIDARDIDQVYHGQEAALQFKAFNRRTTHLIMGQVVAISADAFIDAKNAKAKPYYEVAVALDPSELERLEGQTLVPGMPVEAFISTDARTPLAYVTRPILQYLNRAMRDS